MKLESSLYFKSSADMSELPDASVDLVVTSPPYPMISMWDEAFSSQSEKIAAALEQDRGMDAWEQMNGVLDRVWTECYRVLRNGGFICVNIGDAARTVDGDFRLYPNHSRISSVLTSLGFSSLPLIHWFKPTNAPNKFMGSGMLPSGAYVTLEHEYILVFRKGRRRIFKPDESALRRRSAFFWEERNRWFSDVWDFRGVNQPLKKKDTKSSGSSGPGTIGPGSSGNGSSGNGSTGLRDRSGAYPLELPHRLINMYSLQGDTVLDPFLGTGTTLAAAVINGRRCAGYETEKALEPEIKAKAAEASAAAAGFNAERIENHRLFMEERTRTRGAAKYLNTFYNLPVVTAQEVDLKLPELTSFECDERFIADYK